jgi:DNA-binding NarL/FixJ family response regulator
MALRKGDPGYKQIVLNTNEQTFLELCCSEMVYKEIAKQMGLSVRTVEGYRDDLFAKLGVNTRTGLVIYALKHGMVNL